MEIIILLILIVLGIILYQDHPMFANTFILLAGVFTAWTGLTTNTITAITGSTITYAPVDSWITYALSLIFIAIAVINYLDLIDMQRSEQNARNAKNYQRA